MSEKQNRKSRIVFAIGINDAGKRIDRLLRFRYRNIPLSALYRLLRSGEVRINGTRASVGVRVCADDVVTMRHAAFVGDAGQPTAGEGMLEKYRMGIRARMPTSQQKDGAEKRDEGNRIRPSACQRYNIDTRVGSICFENRHILSLNKRAGAKVFSKNSQELSCQEEVRRYSASNPDADWGVSFLPSALHRLDRNTSGILCFSQSLYGARTFSMLLRGGYLQKDYLALVTGHISATEIWDVPLARIDLSDISASTSNPSAGEQRHVPRAPYMAISGDAKSAVRVAHAKSAKTIIEPLAHGRGCTLVRATIEKGRYHQIRAHAALHKHPLLGDVKYGGERCSLFENRSYFLHAIRIRNNVPATAQSWQQGDSSLKDAALLFRDINCPLSQEQQRRLKRFVPDWKES